MRGVGERAGYESARGAGMARLRTAGRKSAQFRSGFGRGLRCALMLSGNKNVQYTRKSAQFRSGFWRCLRRALVPSGCANGRTARESAYFVRPCALAKIENDRFKKRAKKREKWKGKNRGLRMSLGKNVDSIGFRTMGGAKSCHRSLGIHYM